MIFLQELVKQTEDKFEFLFSHREGFKELDTTEDVLCLKIIEKYTRLSISTEYAVDEKLEEILTKNIVELCDTLRDLVLEYEGKRDKKSKRLINIAWEVRK